MAPPELHPSSSTHVSLFCFIRTLCNAFFFFFFHILAGNLKAVRIGNASEMFSRGNEIHVTRAARRKKKKQQNATVKTLLLNTFGIYEPFFFFF